MKKIGGTSWHFAGSFQILADENKWSFPRFGLQLNSFTSDRKPYNFSALTKENTDQNLELLTPSLDWSKIA